MSERFFFDIRDVVRLSRFDGVAAVMWGWSVLRNVCAV